NMAEKEEGGQNRHHPRIPEAKRRGVEAVWGLGRPGDLGQGDHIRGRPGVFSLGVAETPVGVLANTAECPPVVRTDASADSEIAGVSDHCLGTQRSPLLEVLLDPARLVGAADLGVDAPAEDLGRELARGASCQPAVEDQNYLLGPADVEMVTDQALEEGTASLGTVERSEERRVGQES